MIAKPLSKRILSRGKKHDGECYGAVLDGSGRVPGLAFLRVQGKRESLVYRRDDQSDEIILSSDTFPESNTEKRDIPNSSSSPVFGLSSNSLYAIAALNSTAREINWRTDSGKKRLLIDHGTIIA